MKCQYCKCQPKYYCKCFDKLCAKDIKIHSKTCSTFNIKKIEEKNMLNLYSIDLTQRINTINEIRYEIIKKRIDKAHVKDTNERLTIPGKIAIVYAQDKDSREYIKYIKYLQSKNMLGKLEHLELEDLQGVSGLKALRVEIVYQEDFNEKNIWET